MPEPIYQVMLDPPTQIYDKCQYRIIKAFFFFNQNHLLTIGYSTHLVRLIRIKVYNIGNTQETEANAFAGNNNFRWIERTASKTCLMYRTKA